MFTLYILEYTLTRDRANATQLPRRKPQTQTSETSTQIVQIRCASLTTLPPAVVCGDPPTHQTRSSPSHTPHIPDSHAALPRGPVGGAGQLPLGVCVSTLLIPKAASERRDTVDSALSCRVFLLGFSQHVTHWVTHHNAAYGCPAVDPIRRGLGQL